ncbi:MAG: hypothetical protein V3R99_09510 [Thermoguttaceae bacterium]
MVYRKMFRAASLCGVAAILLTVILLTPTGEARAQGCGLFDTLFGWAQPTTYAAPVGPSLCPPTVSTGCAQTCQYVPQTCYRTVYQRVPVTTYRSVTRCDPCTGCPVTTCCPVTTWTQRATRVPYTTYRLVYTNQYAASCRTCGFGTWGTFGAGGVGCASCQTGGVSTLHASGSTIVTPTPAAPAPDTFKQETQKPQVAPQESERPMEPVPDSSATRYTPSMPRLITPANRMPIHATSREVRPIVHYRPISTRPRPVTPYRAPIDDGGWRASSD